MQIQLENMLNYFNVLLLKMYSNNELEATTSEININTNLALNENSFITKFILTLF